MAAVNTSNGPMAAAEQALKRAKQALIAAEQNRAAAVAEAQQSLATAIAVLNAVRNAMRGSAGSAMLAQYADAVANAEQNIATVTDNCDKQVECAENAVKVAKNALRLVVQATLNGVQNKQKWHASIAAITTIATEANQKNVMEKLKRKQEAEVEALTQEHAKILANDEKTARDRQDAIKTQLDALAEQLKQLELD